MRSHLTHNVFRRLISNEPLRFRCPQSSYNLRPQNAYLPRRRDLFGLSFKRPREPREAQMDPGLKKMNDLLQAENTLTRPPPANEVLKAWKEFFLYKFNRREGVNSYQAGYALRTFRHLQKAMIDGELKDGEGLVNDDLLMALTTLQKLPKDKKDKHNELARELHTALLNCWRGKLYREAWVALTCYISIMAHTGDSKHARDCVLSYCSGSEALELSIGSMSGLWKIVMEGFAQEGDEGELLRTLEMMEELGISTTKNEVQLTMIQFYAQKGNTRKVKEWYTKSSEKGIQPRPQALSTILQFCIAHNELEWCKSVFKGVLNDNPTEKQWNVILQWAAGVMGKGVEEVGRMMEVMNRDPNRPGRYVARADATTINGLVALAMNLNDSYLAERYIALGHKHGIAPNAATYILQIQYRVSAGALTGAQSAYRALQSEEIVEDEDLPTINNYIQALCKAKNPDYDLISSITTDLEERNAHLEAETVVSLCILYLSRNEPDLTLDTLQTQAYHYSFDERAKIREALLEYVLSPDIDVMKAWEAYNIIVVQVFSETGLDRRTQIMQHFFNRRRSDMALHVFGHMRSDIRPTYRPVLSTYVECLEGLASCADRESLDIVYNMLKMDSSIEPNTAVYNALMHAYTECEHSEKAVRFWDDITNSAEGPSYRSLELVFRACQRKPFGDQKAKSIWAQMRRMEIEITREVFVAYVGALAGQGKLEDAKTMVESGEKDLGLKPDFQT